MPLLRRLISPDKASGERQLPIHQFTAAMAEFKRGEISGAEFVAMFELTPEEVTTLQSWASTVTGSSKTPEQIKAEVQDILELGEKGYYDLSKVQTRLTSLGY